MSVVAIIGVLLIAMNDGDAGPHGTQVDDLVTPSHEDFIALVEKRLEVPSGNNMPNRDELTKFQKELERRVKDRSLLAIDKMKLRDRMIRAEGAVIGQMKRIPQTNVVSAREKKRVAEVDFDIKASAMQDTGDMQNFVLAINKLFHWFDGDKKKYMAPYLPLVQSSGTGKTKLLYEASRAFNEDADESCKLKIADKSRKLILCHKAPISVDKEVFPVLLDVSEAPSEEVRKRLWKLLEGLLMEGDNVFFFDESQHLTTDNNGWYFRSIRWWLRKWREGRKIVAVFAGTTSKLANFYGEAPESTTSREPDVKYEGDGKLYEPFYMLNTTGLAAVTESNDQQGTEYKASIKYGRLLFSRLHGKKRLDEALPGIFSRMLLSSPGNTWKNDLGACFSILGTRVQMGQVGFDMASKLVSMGYANLTHFSTSTRGVADICFLPDPVCARLAMGLMLPDFDSIDERAGQTPKFWTEQAARIFSCGLCRPQKGDVGEVAAALYLLFCGDSLRLKAAPDLEHFSVPFQDWMTLLKKGRTTESDDTAVENSEVGGSSSAPPAHSNTRSKKKSKKEQNAAEPDPKPMVSFIQVCRNYLRLSLKSMCERRLLKEWYKAGRALYVFNGCPAFDIIAPLCYFGSSGNAPNYCPMLISIKNRLQYSRSQRNAALDAMVNALRIAGVKTAVAMLLLVGLENPEAHVTKDVNSQFMEGQVALFEVAVPADDEFGVNDFVHASTNGGGESTEVYASHSEAMLVRDVDVKKLLRAKTKTTDESYKLLENLTRSCTIAGGDTSNDVTTMEE